MEQSAAARAFKKVYAVLQNKYFSLVAGCLISGVCGSQYAVGAFNPALKARLGYDQIQINSVSTMANIGTQLGIIPSLFYDVFGARITCLISAALIFGGFFGAFTVSAGWIHVPSIVVGLFFAVMGQGSSGAYTAALSTNLKNFPPEKRGAVVGALAAFFGLSGAFFSFSYKLVFAPDVTHFLLFAACCGLVPLLGVVFLARVLDPVEESAKNADAETPAKQVEEEKQEEEEETTAYGEPKTKNYYQVLNDGDATETKASPARRVFGFFFKLPGDQVPYYNPFQMAFTIDFLLAAFMFFAGVGSGLVILNNMGSMILSYGGDAATVPYYVIVTSIANCAGRFMYGFASDRFSAYLSRVGFFSIAVIGTGVASFLFAYATVPYVFYGVAILFGASYGGLWAMGPSFLAERFGDRWFGVNFSVLCIASSLGSVLLATELAGTVYNEYIPTLPDGRKGILCYGRNCFRITMFTDLGLCLLGFIAGLILMYRTKGLYNSLLAKKLSKQGKASSTPLH